MAQKVAKVSTAAVAGMPAGDGTGALSRRQMLASGAAFALLAGCERPPAVIGIDNPEMPVATLGKGWEHTIFIGSSRQASEVTGAFFGPGRSPELTLASVDVHVPPNHVKGRLEVPRALPPDPLTEFAIVAPKVYSSDDSFIASINRALAERAPEHRDVLLFVHGFNTTASEALLRMGQFVHDSGYKGVPVMFTWASAGRATKYVYDMNSALIARQEFGQMTSILSRTNATGFDVFAHSMGCLVVMEGALALRVDGTSENRKRLKSLVLASPDIDIDLFEAQMRMLHLDKDRIFVLVSNDDRALKLSRFLSGGVERLGLADADRVAALGVNVVDLTKITDEASGTHSKFASSPEVVQLIGVGLNSNPGALDGGTTLGKLLTGVPITVIRG